MKREIYVVIAKAVDAAGSFNDLSGYPATFDSHTLNDDVEKANARAKASYYSACSAGETARSNGRPLTIVSLLCVSTGLLIESARIGEMPEIPDPEPVIENGGEE